MHARTLLLPLAAALALSVPGLCAPALAGTAPPAAPVPPAVVVRANAEIPFADHRAVDNWHAVNDHEIWFEDSRRQWYRATLMSPAFDLPFGIAVGIDTGPMGTLDRFGAVVVKGRKYPFASFDLMSGPPPGLSRKARKH